MPSQGEIKAVASVLGDPENAELTAEEVAEKAIQAYEEQLAKTHNLIVLGHFRLNETESYVAAVGPLSTRATARARGVGERFAWDYKTRKGAGKFVLVPLIRNPNEAWDDLRLSHLVEYEGHMGSVTPGVEPSYEPMRFELSDETRARIAAMADAEEPYYATGEPYEKGPACVCGVLSVREGVRTCTCHPKESSDQRPDPAGD